LKVSHYLKMRIVWNI